jgi:hypothetical protein
VSEPSRENGVRKDLVPRDPAETNVLTVALPGLRRVDVLLIASADTHGESSDLWWYVSAFATLANDLGTAFGLKNINAVVLAPSLVAIPPLGARCMHVLTAFWPEVPAAVAISFLFSRPGDQPSGKAVAIGYPSATPHDYTGLHLAPFGHLPRDTRVTGRADEAEFHRLQLERGLPPQTLPSRTPARKAR